jgi:hypothetical protein
MMLPEFALLFGLMLWKPMQIGWSAITPIVKKDMILHKLPRPMFLILIIIYIPRCMLTSAVSGVDY